MTQRVGEALDQAYQRALREHHAQTTVEHLLAALLGAGQRHRPVVLQQAGAAPNEDRAPGRRGAEPAAAPVGRGRRAGSGHRVAGARPAARQGRGRGARAQGRVRLRRAPAARHDRRRAARPGSILKRVRRDPRPAAGARCRRCAATSASPRQNPEGDLPGAREVRPRPDAAGRAGQARPGDRPRRGDPPRHPGALAPHQEQPGADRRARRRQDRHRRGPGAAHRPRRRARGAEGQAASSRSTWAR